jgi:DNA-binding transcriptional regulator GbsR (MarR family)
VNKKRDEVVDKIGFILKNSNGLTITEIVKKTKLNRSSVRTALAKLDGAEKVFIRKIGMAKVYFLKGRKK